jgi:hypothetical protein
MVPYLRSLDHRCCTHPSPLPTMPTMPLPASPMPLPLLLLPPPLVRRKVRRACLVLPPNAVAGLMLRCVLPQVWEKRLIKMEGEWREFEHDEIGSGRCLGPAAAERCLAISGLRIHFIHSDA